MKKIIAIILSLVLSAGLFVFTSEASEFGEVSVKVEGTRVIISLVEKSEIGYSFSVDLEDYGVDENSKIDTVIIEEGIEKIYVYSPVVINDIYLPSTLEKGPGRSFVNYHVDESNPFFKDIDGVLFSKDGKTLVSYGEERKDESYKIPEGTENIAYKAFWNEYIKEIIVPDGVKTIDSFGRCNNLEKFELPAALEEFNVGDLGDSKWYNAGDMRIVGDGILIGPCRDDDLTVPEGCRQIAGEAFKSQNFESVYIGGHVEKIGYRAFFGLNTDSITLGEGIREIEHSAFDYVGGYSKKWLESVRLPKSLEKIDSNFFDAPIEKLYIPSEADAAFDDVALYTITESYTYPDLYVDRGGRIAKMAGEKGRLIYDIETGEMMMPATPPSVRRIAEEDFPETVTRFDIGEEVEFGKQKPFIARGDMYVPLRFMCDMYGVDIVWNDELKIAEVGERAENPKRGERHATFGDESLVLYNGQPLPADFGFMRSGWYPPDVGDHSAINIDGCIYVPLRDFVEGTDAVDLYAFAVTWAWPILVE